MIISIIANKKDEIKEKKLSISKYSNNSTYNIYKNIKLIILIKILYN